LMIQIDEGLMQSQHRTPAATKPAPCYVIQLPPLAPAGTPASTTTASSAPASTSQARGTTPVKVEMARQFTRLTPEERAQLQRTGACFYCRERGHMASQCPRHPARVNAIEVPTQSQPVSQTMSVPAPIPIPVSTSIVEVSETTPSTSGF
jgi:hypothetical protein